MAVCPKAWIRAQSTQAMSDPQGGRGDRSKHRRQLVTLPTVADPGLCKLTPKICTAFIA